MTRQDASILVVPACTRPNQANSIAHPTANMTEQVDACNSLHTRSIKTLDYCVK